MDPTLTSILRDLGPAGILGVALYFCVRALAPAIQGLIDAQRELASARKAQADASQAVLKRWEESDKALEDNRREHVDALRLVATRLEKLDITDTQRIKQNDVIHGVVNGLKADIHDLPRIFERGKDDAVEKVVKAMNDKLSPIEEKLTHIATEQARLAKEVQDTLALIRETQTTAAPPPADDKADTDAGAE